MRNMTKFTVRYEAITNHNVSERTSDYNISNIRYYQKGRVVGPESSSNPTEVSFDDLITLLLNEIQDRDNIINHIEGIDH